MIQAGAALVALGFASRAARRADLKSADVRIADVKSPTPSARPRARLATIDPPPTARELAARGLADETAPSRLSPRRENGAPSEDVGPVDQERRPVGRNLRAAGSRTAPVTTARNTQSQFE